jgi:hypothetical protein
LLAEAKRQEEMNTAFKNFMTKINSETNITKLSNRMRELAGNMGQKFNNKYKNNAKKAIFAKHTSLKANAKARANAAKAAANAEARAAEEAQKAKNALAKAEEEARVKAAANKVAANAQALAIRRAALATTAKEKEQARIAKARAALNAKKAAAAAKEAEAKAAEAKAAANAKAAAEAKAAANARALRNVQTRANALLAQAAAATQTRANALLAQAGPPAKSANAKMRRLAALNWIQSAWPLSGQEGNPVSGYKGWKKGNVNIFRVIGNPKNMNFYNVNAAVAGKNWNPPRNGLGGGLVRNWQKRKQRILNLATHFSRRKT